VTAMHGRPTAAELVAAVADFVESDVRGATDGQVNFHARVAANVLRIVERELTAGTTAQTDEDALAAAIRNGTLEASDAELMTTLRTLVYDRLAVANPSYALASVADRLFSALERGDVDAVAAMWSDDVTAWHVGDRRPREKARALRVIEWFVNATSDRHYDVLDRQFFEGGFVQQHVLHGHTRDQSPYTIRVGIVIGVRRDGLISSIDEYFDPADLAPLQNQQH
jgi:ketosteroid isomerase-like protein